ncbi:transcriptional regulator [Streptomyces rimosus]|uniref:transcriptional regulator n=1 Tax=Streptomyces rimosus TaxID=1927 RepID=UPI0031D43A18
MAGRWRELGRYNAQGIGGGDALGYGIERMVTGLQSSAHSERGIAARLRYLTASEAGYAAMERAGINVTARTLYAWLAEERSPNVANRQKLDDAYWDLRRRNVAADLKRRLTSRGGTRIEINPVDQTRVEARHQRDLSTRRLTVRPRFWDAAVDAWLADDADALDRIWGDLIPDLGSDYDAYSNVSSVGWAA